jgi:hypothetical protein
MRISLVTIIAFFLVNFLYAQTNYYVDNSGSDVSGNGTGPGTLAWKTIEYAVNNVSNPPADSIIINISGGIYNLSNDQIDIDRNFKNLTLLGQGIDATIVESASDTSLSNSRGIKIYLGNNVLLKNLTVRYGKTLSSDSLGGGILNQGTLVIDYCKVTENLVSKDGHNGIGGGIANEGGNLTVKNSTISFNTAPDNGQGGGIGSVNGTLNVYNSTICYNVARLTVGGIFVASSGADAFFNMENSTVFGNSAFKYGGVRITRFGYPSTSFNVTSEINSCTIFKNSAYDVYGGVGLTVPSNCTIKNTIVAGNFAYNQGATASPSNLTGSSGSISITSGGYNIIQSVSNVTIDGAQNNGLGLDPSLLPLADNNSSNGTQTCAIPDSSPAKDAILAANDYNGAPLLDQRDFQRVGNYDIGAYEFAGMPITYSISGNTMMPGVTLSWTDGTLHTATADSSGAYSFMVSYNWSGTVTPSLTGYTFTPANIVYPNVLSDQINQNYTAATITYSISGNAGKAGITLSWTDGTLKTATADSTGAYSFTVSYNWSGTVTPSLASYKFTPAYIVYANVLADMINKDYIATPFVVANIKVFLEGPYNGTGMNTTLNTNNLIPLNSNDAYSTSTYGYTASTVTSIPNADIIDWVLLELRTGTNPDTKVSTRAAFLKSDGTLVDTTGSSPVQFTNLSEGNYYIVIRHRNHLAVMSKDSVALSGSSSLYDFTAAQDQAYGTNPMKALDGGGGFGMIAGNNDGDLIILPSDYNAVGNNLTHIGYEIADHNMSGVVLTDDYNYVANNLTKYSQVP